MAKYPHVFLDTVTSVSHCYSVKVMSSVYYKV